VRRIVGQRGCARGCGQHVCADSDSDSDSDSNSNSNSNSDHDSEPDADADSDAVTHSDAFTDAGSARERFRNFR
jgi:hypothetical protein